MENEETQMKIRVPSGLKNKIQELAKKNKRSMNAEIIAILEKATFDKDSFHTAIQDLKKDIEDSLKNAIAERDKVYQEFIDKRYNKK